MGRPRAAISALVVALFVIVIAVSAGTGYLAGVANQRTVTPTTTETAYSTQARFDLIFVQNALCPHSIGYIIPWTVTLSDNQSITSDAKVQCCTNSLDGPSVIGFSVPTGAYSYSITPDNILTPAEGTVTVESQGTTVMVNQMLASCGSTTTS